MLVLAIEARAETTHGHSLKVARIAKQVALEMGLASNEVEIIFHAGLLHDIGKIGLEDDILERLGTLSPKEMHLARQHPLIGADIVKPLTFLAGLEPIIKYHHERYNGSGYPEGLKGEAIPMGARIIGVCDVFETMISGRRHIQKSPLHQALSALKKGAGRNFAPHVVDALITVIKKDPEGMRSIDSMEKEADDALRERMKNTSRDYPICF